jgi:hypothetical protein
MRHRRPAWFVRKAITRELWRGGGGTIEDTRRSPIFESHPTRVKGRAKSNGLVEPNRFFRNVGMRRIPD